MTNDLKNIASTIRSRRTVKQFTNKNVDSDLILKAIDLARLAPNHHLTEPWHFYILNDYIIKKCIELIRVNVTEKKGEEIGNFKAENSKLIPGWLVVTSKLSESKLTQQEDYASVCCAIQNFSLYLTEAGLASKWSTGAITRDNRFYDLLSINTKSEVIVGLIWYGYPKQLHTQSRGKLDDILTVND